MDDQLILICGDNTALDGDKGYTSNTEKRAGRFGYRNVTVAASLRTVRKFSHSPRSRISISPRCRIASAWGNMSPRWTSSDSPSREFLRKGAPSVIKPRARKDGKGFLNGVIDTRLIDQSCGARTNQILGSGHAR